MIDFRDIETGGGSVGNGNSSADTTALLNAWQMVNTPVPGSGLPAGSHGSSVRGEAIYIPGGMKPLQIEATLDSDDVAGGSLGFAFIGDGPAATRIDLLPGVDYLFDVAKPIRGCNVRGLQVAGGGVFRRRDVGTTGDDMGPVIGQKNFDDIACVDFPDAAFVSNNLNDPNYRITNWFTVGLPFDPAEPTDPRPIAMIIPPGSNNYVGQCYAAGHYIGIVLPGGGKGVWVDKPRFGGKTGSPRIDTLVVPYSGPSLDRGCFLRGLYSGAENDDPPDIELLIADVDASNGLEKLTVLDTPSTGQVNGLSVEACWIGGAGRTNAPIVSRCPNTWLEGRITLDKHFPAQVDFDGCTPDAVFHDKSDLVWFGDSGIDPLRLTP